MLASRVAAGATRLGAWARAERRGAHPRRDHPELSPDLQVNFQTRQDADGRLDTASRPVPPAPPELRSWVDAGEDLSTAGRLLE